MAEKIEKIELKKKTNIEEKRYQELGMPCRIVLWLRWMPIGYIKAFGWYFIKRLRWEDICDDEEGRVRLGTCIGICVGMVQANMRWYYTSDEVFREDGELIIRDVKKSSLEKIGEFIEDKLIEIIDGKPNIY